MSKEKTNVESEIEVVASLSPVEIALAKLQKDVERLTSQNQMLTDIANESRKEKWNEKNLKNKIVSIVKLSTIDGKIIVSWRNVIDEVFKLASGEWTENQVNEYETEGGEKIMLPLLEAVRKIVKIDAEVLSISVDNEIEGKDDTVETTYLYKVKTEEGKEVIISNKFIN